MKNNKIIWTRLSDDDVGFSTSEKSETFQVKGKTSVVYGKESSIQILYTNDSYQEQELCDYQTMRTNYAQLYIVNKIKLPLRIGKRSKYTFEITIKGRYLGESKENVEFVFKNCVQKVNIPIVVTDERLKWLHDVERGSKATVNARILHEVLENPGVRGIRKGSLVKYKIRNPLIKGTWDIPRLMWDCYKTKNTKSAPSNKTNCLKHHFPVAFDDLTYQNYQDKFHALLYMNELEVAISLQTFAQECVNFTKHDEYLVLKIPNLSKRRPTLIPNDWVVAMSPSGNERYQGFIHEVKQNEIWLMFNKKFHRDCLRRIYNVIFFNNRLSFIKQHEIIKNFLKNNLSEEFLFPKCSLTYQPPQLEIVNKTEFGTTSRVKKKKRKRTQLPRLRVVENIGWFHENLNDEQKSAVINILKGEGRPMPYVIYGPPGTGKTITLTESIIQVNKLFPKNKLLICAPTNAGANLLLGELVKSGLFKKTVLKRLISANYYNSRVHNKKYDEYCIVSYTDLTENDSKLIKEKNVPEIIITTVYTAGTLYAMGFERGDFSHIFIDEAGQAMEPETLFPLSFLDKGNQVILAGDPKQLQPVVISKLAKENGLRKSMLDRFINSSQLYKRDRQSFPQENGFNPKLITHLIRNYRSLPEIVNVFSSMFYDDIVKATKTGHDEKERILLNQLNRNAYWDIGCNGPVVVHGVSSDECIEKSGTSFYNPHEALHACLYFEKLVKSGISPDDIGIITPYVSQVAQINLYLNACCSGIKLPQVSSVELFQGQERMVIIISLVRSSGSIRFIASEERINVAMSRAKALVIVIGNPSIMRQDPHWRYILKKAIEKKNYVGNNPTS